MKSEKIKLEEFNIKFYLIGDGRARVEILQLIEKFDISNLITWIPAKAAELIPQYLANADAALLLIKNHPAMTKVLPAKVASYVGCGKAIFCISDGPLANFIDEHQLGYASHSFNHAIITQSLKKFIHKVRLDKTEYTQSKDFLSPKNLMHQLETDLLKPLWRKT